MVQTVTVGSPSRQLTTVTGSTIVAVLVTAGWVVLQAVLLSRPPSSAAETAWSGLLAAAAWALPGAALLSVAALACSAGLMMRMEWARRVLVGLLSALALANLTALWLQHAWSQAVLDLMAEPALRSAAAQAVLADLLGATRFLGITLTLLTCAALAWVIVRLMSGPVRRECV